MYFLKVAPLKAQLAGAGLTERERFRYLMAQALLYALTVGGEPSMSDMAKWLIVGITIAGVVWAYRRNGGADGQALLDRWISLSLVVNLRVLLSLALLSALLHIPMALGLTDSLDDVMTGAFGLLGTGGLSGLWDLITLAAEAWVAWSVGRHIGEVRLAAAGGAPHAAPAALYGGAAPARTAPSRTSSAELDRFVETVTQRELASRVAPRRGPGRRPARSRVRLIRSKRRR